MKPTSLLQIHLSFNALNLKVAFGLLSSCFYFYFLRLPTFLLDNEPSQISTDHKEFVCVWEREFKHWSNRVCVVPLRPNCLLSTFLWCCSFSNSSLNGLGGRGAICSSSVGTYGWGRGGGGRRGEDRESKRSKQTLFITKTNQITSNNPTHILQSIPYTQITSYSKHSCWDLDAYTSWEHSSCSE